MNASHSTDLYICSNHHFHTNSIAPPPPTYKHTQLTIYLFALTKGLRSKRQIHYLFNVEIYLNMVTVPQNIVHQPIFPNETLFMRHEESSVELRG